MHRDGAISSARFRTDRSANSAIAYTVIGEVTDRASFEYGHEISISLREALDAWNAPLEKVFPTELRSRSRPGESRGSCYKARRSVTICNHKIGTAQRIYSGVPGNQL